MCVKIELAVRRLFGGIDLARGTSIFLSVESAPDAGAGRPGHSMRYEGKEKSKRLQVEYTLRGRVRSVSAGASKYGLSIVSVSFSGAGLPCQSVLFQQRARLCLL